MHAVDQGRAAFLKGLGRRDIGLDHELLDELMSIEALGVEHPLDDAMRIEKNFPLRQVEFKRLAACARLAQGIVGLPQRLAARDRAAGPFLASGRPSIAACASS